MVVRLQSELFDVAAETAALTQGRTDIGAVVTFTGVCRGIEAGEPIAALTLIALSFMTPRQVRRAALILLGLGWIWRKGAESAVPLVLVATIFLFVAGGLADVTTLGNSQIPSTFSAGFARLLVMLTLGLGAGLAVAAALRLRPASPTRPAPRRTRPAAPVSG